MPRNAGGTYVPPAGSWNPAVPSTNATVNDWNDLRDDITTALTTSIATSGVSVVTANIPMASKKLTGLAAGTTAGDSARFEQVQPNDATLTALAALSWTAGVQFPVFTGADILSLETLSGKATGNRLINGTGLISQRVAATSADGTYSPVDRWYVLTQSNPITVANSTPRGVAPDSSWFRLTQSNATPQRMGGGQIIEFANILDLRSQVATLSALARYSNTANIRMAVLEWTGTADAPTKDVVNDWTSSTYTPSNFFISTVNVLATASIACTATVWRALSAMNATFGASTNNAIVFFWTEAVAAQNSTLDLAQIQFEPGSIATGYETRKYHEELAACQRYAWLVPGAGISSGIIGLGTMSTTANINTPLIFPRMRVAPSLLQSASITWVSTAGGPAAGNSVGALFGLSQKTISGALTVQLVTVSVTSALLQFVAGTSFSGSVADTVLTQLGSGAYLLLDAEIGV